MIKAFAMAILHWKRETSCDKKTCVTVTFTLRINVNEAVRLKTVIKS